MRGGPVTHGHVRFGRRSRELRSYRNMMQRCTNPNHPRRGDYAGRGITICDRWLASFENFLADMGPCPEGMTLDRRDNDLGYSLENCRWATGLEQGQNKRNNTIVDVRGESIPLLEAIRRHAIVSKRTVFYRIARGWKAEAALLTPPNQEQHAGGARP